MRPTRLTGIRQAIPHLLLLAVLVLGACGTSVQTDHGLPPSITLADTSPTYLDVTAGITIGGYDSSTRSITEIAIQFFSHAAPGRLVSFQKGEMLACQGEAPVPLGTGFDQRYPTATVAGRSFTCRYISGQSAATLQFLIPRAPTIHSPTEGATVARSRATPIRFQADGAVEGIVALGAKDKAIAQVDAPGVASVDTSQFAAGSGTIALTQFPRVVKATATAFASFQTHCTAVAQIEVTWA